MLRLCLGREHLWKLGCTARVAGHPAPRSADFRIPTQFAARNKRVAVGAGDDPAEVRETRTPAERGIVFPPSTAGGRSWLAGRLSVDVKCFSQRGLGEGHLTDMVPRLRGKSG